MARGADRQARVLVLPLPLLLASSCASCFTALGASVFSSVKRNGPERGANLLG